MSTRTSATIVGILAALAHVSCQAILTAPVGSTLQLVANPEFIPASGGVSIISALLIEPAGTPVADGTVVQFFTTLGVIDEQGKTNDGVARVNLVADSRSGTANVTAFSGAAASEAGVTVMIGSALPTRIVMTAHPTRLVKPESVSRIVVNVFDANGNPVANVPVILSLGAISAPQPTPTTTTTTTSTTTTTVAPFVGGLGEDPRDLSVSNVEVRLESAGAQLFTDNNGRVEDELVVESGLGGDAQTVTVSGITANNISGSVQVTIN